MAEKINYERLARFLMTPFLDSPEGLKIDAEQLNAHSNVWLRVAFSPEERGRMFGRGGRNIQAIRTVLQATATLHGQRAALDVHGESSGRDRSGAADHSTEGEGHRRRRSPRPSRK